MPRWTFGIFVAVCLAHRIDDGLRLLRGGGVVEIDERLAIDLAGEDREIRPDLLDVSRARS